MLHLASRSPRRRELLAQMGLEFAVVAAAVDETRRADEPAAEYVSRVAADKARAGLAACTASVGDSDSSAAWVVGADTAVVVDGAVFGKPSDESDAIAQLEALSGRSHLVFSGVALAGPKRDRLAVRVSRTRVWFRHLERAEMRWYWATGEPRDKAGGYAIQGLAAAFVRRIEGSYSGVMGLPLFETMALLRDSGYPPLSDARAEKRRALGDECL